MIKTKLLKILVLIVTLSFLVPLTPTHALTITLHVPDSITIGKPFRVWTNKLPEGSKIKIMINGNFPPPRRSKIAWTLVTDSNGVIDEKLEIPIGSKFDNPSRALITYRYYDPKTKQWLEPTSSVFTSISYSDVWIDLKYPVRRSYVLEIMHEKSGLVNSTIINRLSDLYYLEDVVSNCNLWWKRFHKIKR